MGPAAALNVLVQVKGLSEATRGLRSVDSDLRKTAAGASTATKTMEDTGKRGSRSLGLLKKATGAIGGVVAFATLGKGVKMAVGEFEEARKVGALTENVIKSTGGAANVTAKEVGDLATSISKKVGIDDEAIQSGANLLLTFKNVRNETGKGRDIFNQATKAAVDLSAAGFGSLESTSKQLGKALNDPIKGMTALGRSGVTFSEDQKKAITALVETGKATDRVKAQQMILKEVNSQVGGAAAAQATSMDKLKVTLGNVAEAAGGVLVPAFDKGARALASLLNGMIEGRGVGGALVSVFKTTIRVVGDVVGATRDLVGWFRQHETVTLALGAALGVVLAAFASFKILAGVQAAIIAVRAAMLGLNAAFLANPIVLVVAVLAALAAAFVVAYRKSETFRDIVDGTWDAVKGASSAALSVLRGVFDGIGRAFSALGGAFQAIGGGIVSGTREAWNLVKTYIVEPVQSAASGVRNALGQDGLAGWLGAAWNSIRGAANTAWDVVRNHIVEPVRDAASVVRNTLGADGLTGWLGAVWGNIRGAANTAWDVVKKHIVEPIGEAASAVRNALGSEGLTGWLSAVWNNIRGAANRAWDAVKDNIVEPVKSAASAVRNALGSEGLLGWLSGIVNNARDLGGRIGGAIKGGITSAIDGVIGMIKGVLNNVIGAANRIIRGVNKLPKVDIPLIPHLAVGARNFPGGLAMVGERGPELVNLPRGSDVYTAPQTRAMTRQPSASPMGGSDRPMVNIEHLEVHDRFDEQRLASDLAWKLQAA